MQNQEPEGFPVIDEFWDYIRFEPAMPDARTAIVAREE
jgi:hypothetical protein